MAGSVILGKIMEEQKTGAWGEEGKVDWEHTWRGENEATGGRPCKSVDFLGVADEVECGRRQGAPPLLRTRWEISFAKDRLYYCCEPTAQDSEPLQSGMQHLFSKHSTVKLQQQRVSSSGNCTGELGLLALSTVASLLREGPGETWVTRAATSISYMRNSDLLLKDSKDNGKSVISGISRGKLGPSGWGNKNSWRIRQFPYSWDNRLQSLCQGCVKYTEG